MTVNVLDLYEKDSSVITYTDGAERMEIVTPDHEDGFCLVLRNTASETATVRVKAGNSIYAMGDLEVSLNASEDAVINLKNTGRFKNVNGEDSGKIIVEISASAPADIKVCPFSL